MIDKRHKNYIVIVVAIIAILCVIGVTYVELNKGFAVDVDVVGEGTIIGEGTYDEGSSITLKAVPDYGYTFAGWYDNGRFVSNVATLKTTADNSHNLKAVFEKQTYTLTYSYDYDGGSVSGFGTYEYQSTATIYANVKNGYTFTNWTENGKILSTGTTLHYTVTKNSTITANYSIIHDASFVVSKTSSKAPSTLTMSSKYNVEIKSRTWTISDDMTKGSLFGSGNSSINSFKYSVNSCKALNITQTITYSDGQKSTFTDTVVVDGTLTKSFAWKYQSDDWFSELLSINNEGATWDIPMTFSWYYKYHTSTISRSNAYNQLPTYVTFTDAKIVSMAKGMNSFTSGLSDLERINCVLKFVQSIPYQYDKDGKGVSDYWDYPAEILWEQKGDCEDHAILFAALVEAMGYQVVLNYVYCHNSDGTLDGHIAPGVAVNGASGSYVTVSGVKYYYCEATAVYASGNTNYANVGYIPSGYEVISTYKV